MPSPLNDFVELGPRTSLFTPQKPSHGQLIVLCTWLGAAHKHIFKYTSLYKGIAPGARILLVESNIRSITSSYVKQREAIKPAVSAALDTLAECGIFSSNTTQVANDSHHTSSSSNTNKATPQILLHVFSNGGTTTATQLLLVLNAHLNVPLPLVGLLCDSCPAKGTYWRSYDAMVLSLPNNLATQLLGALVCHCILVMLYTWIACGNENPASLHRRTMLDGEMVSASGGEGNVDLGKKKAMGRVCYFYSKADRMCLWSDIKDHANDARRLGWDVSEVIFEGSGHCAHFSMDKEKYADAVKSIWGGEGSWLGKKDKSKL